MLEVQNSPQLNNIKFRSRNEDIEYDAYEEIDLPETEEDSFESTEGVACTSPSELERDKKLEEINKTRESLDELADNLEKSDNKLHKKASKAVRFASGLFGLAGTFIMAKYGSKVTIGTLRNIGKTTAGKSSIEALKSIYKPLTSSIGTANTWIVEKSKPLVETLKETRLGKKVVAFTEQPKVKSIKETIGGYKEAVQDIYKSINGDKVQTVLENTMAASTTASVLIDDLAGRNDNKSNLDLALGASGGDR